MVARSCTGASHEIRQCLSSPLVAGKRGAGISAHRCLSSARSRPPTPPSASSMSGRATITATTRRMPQGAAALKKMAGVKVVEEENVPETDAVEKTMESMINLDGATLLFPTSFGYFDPHILQDGGEIPEGPLRAWRRPVDRQGPEEHRQLFRLHRRGAVHQRHRRRLRDQDRASSASSRPSRSRRCCATSTPSRSAPGSSIRRRRTQVIFTGDWSMPVKEAEATNSLVDQGIDVITCMSTARRSWCRTPRGAAPWCAAITPARRRWRPKAYLTGAEWNWEALYPQIRHDVDAGETIPNFYRGGLQGRAHQAVALWPEGRRRGAQARRRHQGASSRAGNYVIFKGPLEGQQGQDRDRRRASSRGQKDPELEKMDYLVEGVIGATS